MWRPILLFVAMSCWAVGALAQAPCTLRVTDIRIDALPKEGGASHDDERMAAGNEPREIPQLEDRYAAVSAKWARIRREQLERDRLDTDILFGANNGLKSCLTLSGATTEAKLLSKENEIKPDFYVDSIAQFM